MPSPPILAVAQGARRAGSVEAAPPASVVRVLHPVGPLLPAVYWRRRVAVAAGGLVAVAAVWLVLPGGGAGPQPGPRSAATGPTSAARSTPNSSPAPGPLAATPPAIDPGFPADGNGTAAQAAAAPQPAGTGQAGSAGPPALCPDSALTLRVTSEKPTYQIGDMPVIRLTVADVSAAPCLRDLGAAQQEILLYADGRRLWSSDDCYPGTGADPQVLQPGRPTTVAVVWSGLSSQPACAGTRVGVGPGRYTLVGRLGSLRSPPGWLTVR